MPLRWLLVFGLGVMAVAFLWYFLAAFAVILAFICVVAAVGGLITRSLGAVVAPLDAPRGCKQTCAWE
ncbi:MAG: hypothetical protein JWO45_1614 [Spartobacteria bacterium]|nr:hypothetical protein [Spartobacteria bacterium]